MLVPSHTILKQVLCMAVIRLANGKQCNLGQISGGRLFSPARLAKKLSSKAYLRSNTL
jgi:hypothetical protein